mgnify:CR=1 FL=1
MTSEEKAWIDGATYEQLLSRWRFQPVGTSTWFTGETGEYFATVMKTKRAEVGNAEHVRASKHLGWEG